MKKKGSDTYCMYSSSCIYDLLCLCEGYIYSIHAVLLYQIYIYFVYLFVFIRQSPCWHSVCTSLYFSALLGALWWNETLPVCGLCLNTHILMLVEEATAWEEGRMDFRDKVNQVKVGQVQIVSMVKGNQVKVFVVKSQKVNFPENQAKVNKINLCRHCFTYKLHDRANSTLYT